MLIEFYQDKEMKLVKYSANLVQFSLFIALVWICPVAAESIDNQSNLLAEEIKETEKLGNREMEGITASDLLAQGVTRVTGVKLNQTETGLELILETAAESQRLVPLILPEGNKLVIDILDATLELTTGSNFREVNPAPGIREVTVTKIDDSSIRLTITGENQPPSAEVIPSNQNLLLSIDLQGNTAEPPFEGKQTPDEEIEVIATGEAENDNYSH